MTLILLLVVALLLLVLPLSLPRGRILVGYVIVSSLGFAGLWYLSLVEPSPVFGDNVPGIGLALVLLLMFSLAHGIGVLARIAMTLVRGRARRT